MLAEYNETSFPPKGCTYINRKSHRVNLFVYPGSCTTLFVQQPYAKYQGNSPNIYPNAGRTAPRLTTNPKPCLSQ